MFDQVARLDSTSLSLYGDYKSEEAELQVTPGYAKNKRFDLKQEILSLVQTGPAGCPIWMEALSGNQADKSHFQETICKMEAFKAQLKEAPDLRFIGDSALYSAKKLLSVPWIARVPTTLLDVKALCTQPKEAFHWLKLASGYEITTLPSTYGGISQRWQLVYSEQAYQRERKTLQKHISQEHQTLTDISHLFFKKHDLFLSIMLNYSQ